VITSTFPGAAEVNQAMGRVYAYMGLATLVSMFTSWYVGSSTALMSIFFTGWMLWVTLLSPLVFIFIIPFALESNLPRYMAVTILAAFAALMGLSLASVFAIYTLGSIFSAFMGASVLFGVMAAYGYFTKQDLDSFGKYLFIALIALIIAMIINIFIGSTVMQMAISAIAILVFMGLTAYDTQRIRDMLRTGGGNTAIEVMGALSLYLDFINLFIHLLQLFGVKKSD
jgi:FtsH-binding integral membrane protein